MRADQAPASGPGGLRGKSCLPPGRVGARGSECAPRTKSANQRLHHLIEKPHCAEKPSHTLQKRVTHYLFEKWTNIKCAQKMHIHCCLEKLHTDIRHDGVNKQGHSRRPRWVVSSHRKWLLWLQLGSNSLGTPVLLESWKAAGEWSSGSLMPRPPFLMDTCARSHDGYLDDALPSTSSGRQRRRLSGGIARRGS